jgi:cell wall-associated NlpC family hydrolase
LDKRTTAARPDLAAASLKGKVEAARFAEGELRTVARGRAALRAAPDADAEQVSELLFGEDFAVYESKAGWSWGQAARDNYVGYVASTALDAPLTPTHRVAALATPLLLRPDVKAASHDVLPLNARVAVESSEGGFARLAAGFVAPRHLVPHECFEADFVLVAERFVGTPYVWGGRTRAGLDCSGLVQTALAAAGIAAPRDTDMMEKTLGVPVAAADLRRGDLVFWKGHMGVMLDASRLLHANAFHMEVAVEPLAAATLRIASLSGPVTAIKRLA